MQEMDEIHRRTRKTTLVLLLGTVIMVLFFAVAVKFSVFLSGKMEGEKLPEITSPVWFNRAPPLAKGVPAPVTVIFFWKEGVKVAEDIFRWAGEWEEKYRQKRLRIVAIAFSSGDDEKDAKQIKEVIALRKVKFEIVLDVNGANRKRMRNATYSFVYIIDRYGTIAEIGKAQTGKERLERIIFKHLFPESADSLYTNN